MLSARLIPLLTPWRRYNYAVMLVLCLLASPQAHAQEFHSYLLRSSVESNDLSPFYKWNGMVEHYQKQQAVPDSHCDKVAYHPCTVLRWKKMVASIKGKPFLTQLAAINDYANAFPYTTPMENWHKEDYWETPYEFLQVSGNCKDYAIIKYYSLRLLGFPPEQLRLIVLKDMNLGGVIHAILGVYNKGKLYILDNQVKQVVLADDIYHYVPIYAINEKAWWRYDDGTAEN